MRDERSKADSPTPPQKRGHAPINMLQYENINETFFKKKEN